MCAGGRAAVAGGSVVLASAQDEGGQDLAINCPHFLVSFDVRPTSSTGTHGMSASIPIEVVEAMWGGRARRWIMWNIVLCVCFWVFLWSDLGIYVVALSVRTQQRSERVLICRQQQ